MRQYFSWVILFGLVRKKVATLWRQKYRFSSFCSKSFVRLVWNLTLAKRWHLCGHRMFVFVRLFGNICGHFDIANIFGARLTFTTSSCFACKNMWISAMKIYYINDNRIWYSCAFDIWWNPILSDIGLNWIRNDCRFCMWFFFAQSKFIVQEILKKDMSNLIFVITVLKSKENCDN